MGCSERVWSLHHWDSPELSVDTIVCQEPWNDSAWAGVVVPGDPLWSPPTFPILWEAIFWGCLYFPQFTQNRSMLFILLLSWFSLCKPADTQTQGCCSTHTAWCALLPKGMEKDEQLQFSWLLDHQPSSDKAGSSFTPESWLVCRWHWKLKHISTNRQWRCYLRLWP